MGPPLILILILGNSSHHGHELKNAEKWRCYAEIWIPAPSKISQNSIDNKKKVRYNGVATHPSAHYYERRQSCETHTRKIMIP